MLLSLVTHAEKECPHQLALPWAPRHLISPELAGTDVMILLLSPSCCTQSGDFIRGFHNLIRQAILGPMLTFFGMMSLCG